MTRGRVTDLQATVDVVLRVGNLDVKVECVVDTGFAGALTLPESIVTELGLLFFQEIFANLANDQDVRTAVHVATIVWEGRETEVAILAMGRRPLLGTALLESRRLTVDLVEGGPVMIETIPTLV